jgi:hypothetical protein
MKPSLVFRRRAIKDSINSVLAEAGKALKVGVLEENLIYAVFHGSKDG